MRTPDVQQLGMFSYVSVDARVLADHPIRKLRELVDGVIAEMNSLFEQRYAKTGRPSIPPEGLLRAWLLQGRNEDKRSENSDVPASRCPMAGA